MLDILKNFGLTRTSAACLKKTGSSGNLPGEEDTVMDERKDDDEIIEDEVLSRLRRKEQDYLQEQEETNVKAVKI
jgi:hypothetical protein